MQCSLLEPKLSVNAYEVSELHGSHIKRTCLYINNDLTNNSNE